MDSPRLYLSVHEDVLEEDLAAISIKYLHYCDTIPAEDKEEIGLSYGVEPLIGEEIHQENHTLGQNELLIKLNEEELIKLLQSITDLDIKRLQLNKVCASTGRIISKLEGQQLLLSEMKYWYIKNGYNDRLSKILNKYESVHAKKVKMSKQDKFNDLFNKFVGDDNADPKEVKRVLYNKDEFGRNPSAYLSIARGKRRIRVADLKRRPGFSWIDPKNTAKDRF